MSCTISAEQLACMREGAEGLLSDTGTVTGRTLVSDGRGGHTETPVTVGTLACRVQRLKEPIEVVNANKVTVLAGYKAWIPADTTLSLTPEKTLTVRGTTYDIIRADLESSDLILGVLFLSLVE